MFRTKLFFGKKYSLQNKEESGNFFETAIDWNRSVSPRVLSRCFIAAAYCCSVLLIYQFFNIQIDMPITPFEYSGAFLAVVLVFRINAGYERWWEARKIWGSIVNQSRNLAQIILTSGADKNDVRKALDLVSKWPQTICDHLRAGEASKKKVGIFKRLFGSKKHLPAPKEGPTIHFPNLIGLSLSKVFQKMNSDGMHLVNYLNLDKERIKMIDNIGMCERIRATPIPLVAAIKVRRMILLFLAMLPVALAELHVWWSFPIFILVSYTLFALDQIGVELQNPFSLNNLSHLPLDSICQKIRQQVQELEFLNESTVDQLEKVCKNHYQNDLIDRQVNAIDKIKLEYNSNLQSYKN